MKTKQTLILTCAILILLIYIKIITAFDVIKRNFIK